MVALYKGNAKIRDIGNFGVFYGNNPIRQVFKGSELVYQYHPFEPQSIIINKSESITVEHSLPQGRYYVECVGGGGGSSYTDSTLCTDVVHTQGYQNGAGYITITTLKGE